jgi:hypothetical protein
MTDIDPIIKRVAEAYGFTIEWFVVTERTIIKHEENHCYFYWDSSESVEGFFIEVRDFFVSIGEQTAGYWN